MTNPFLRYFMFRRDANENFSLLEFYVTWRSTTILSCVKSQNNADLRKIFISFIHVVNKHNHHQCLKALKGN
jgi:hypothetical protein